MHLTGLPSWGDFSRPTRCFRRDAGAFRRVPGGTPETGNLYPKLSEGQRSETSISCGLNSSRCLDLQAAELLHEAIDPNRVGRHLGPLRNSLARGHYQQEVPATRHTQGRIRSHLLGFDVAEVADVTVDGG